MSRQERASRTRQLIIESAAGAFDQEGFALTGLSEIAQLCGVSKGALYFHFGSKEQLAEAVMAESRETLRETVREARRLGGSGLQYLIDLCHGLARRLDQDVVFRAGLRLTEEPGLEKKGCPSPYPAWERLIGRQLARAVRDEDIHPEVLLAEVTSLLAATAAGIETLSRRDKGWLGPHVTAGLWNAVLPALTPVERLGRIRTAPEGSGAALTTPGPHHWDDLPEAAALVARAQGA
ncbi:TetR family transcriptional regulator [Kitasatospora sp. MMS16-BH015]|uniref:ScbR family autoregulator-binding transcription factor n=1 Tax=Kitasatospora sp. MMS16-BH015 TaxID=2018025 RepID=UPI000CA39395|nr:ScbR family autoregulator-binding transcription factor [Kitasatospora sp. MMS16-BH015]AUG78394.1 TetR family transcriptional regulator [Kitasatospora sp. MMS16-BH015]